MSQPLDYPPPVGLPERYADLGQIAVGGMGEVRRIYDTHLERTLALKLIQADNALNPWSRWRFEEEGRVTAQLQHPGIVPVHDLGELPDGRLWYTMREVQGDTLAHILATQGWSIRRRVAALEQVCQIVAYAHEHDVVHRDLKPDNIVVGPFGEVMVLDWGVARRLSQPLPAYDDAEPTFDQPLHTRDGTIVGTPAYMAPEQAVGDLESHGPHTDVYAVGTMLYEALAGRTPYQAEEGLEIWQQLLMGLPPDIATVCEAPEALATLVRACMERLFQKRPTLRDVAERIRAWRDRDEARERAQERVDEATALALGPQTLRDEASNLEQRATKMLADLPPHADPEAKVGAWRLQDDAKEARLEAEILEQRWLQVLHDALEHDPEQLQAHRLLASYWRDRLVMAEARRDPLGAARAQVELERHDVGQWHASWLRGDATLVLQTEPPGAKATLYREVTSDRRRVSIEPTELGTTPLEVQVPPGSYRVVYELEGFHPCEYLAAPGRAERWDLIPPGAELAEPTPLLPLGELPEGCVYVPAGWFRSGGDELAADSLPDALVWVDGFVIQTAPLTFTDWLVYLTEEQGELPGMPGNPVVEHLDGVWGMRADRQENFPLTPEMPVAYVSANGMEAYARWRARRDGRSWGLPHDQAWEKAARGADGRTFPWGDHLEPSWAGMSGSFKGTPTVLPTSMYPKDCSPYGLLGMAGNLRDWCGSGYQRTGASGRVVPTVLGDAAPFRMIRGGSMNSTERNCRLACRYAADPSQVFSMVGGRLAYTVVIGPTATGQEGETRG